MIHRSLRHGAAAVIAIVLLASCAPGRARDEDPAAPFPPGFDAQTVEIVDHWMGLSPDAPLDGTYQLERRGGSYTFAGTATLESGGAPRVKAGPLPITIPDTAMRAFLRGLAAAPRRPGAYTPRIEHTDDYPELTITLRSRQGVVEFYSASQDDRRPWRVTIGGRQYVSDSAAATDALGHLAPFVRRAELDRIIADRHAERI